MSEVVVPLHYVPRPHQQAAWARQDSGKYNYYFKLWARQTGKDTDDIEYCLNRAFEHPGTQSAYVGLDNVWLNNNIFKKYVDNRRFWDDYPSDIIEPKETSKEVYFHNNPEGYAPSRIKFIGFLNDNAAIGSSYDNFYISEVSLYKRNAFDYIEPIWDQKLAQGLDLYVSFNGTPRGQRNVLYDLLRTYTGEDEPEAFPGAHGSTYVDLVKIQDVKVPDREHPGQWRPLYTEAEIEKLQDRYLRRFGNLNLYKQEFECDFTTVNAGLVYQGIELLTKEKRYTSYNLDATKPVYAAFDISSKGSTTDATAGVIYQYYNNKLFIYDIYEQRGKSFVECFTELQARPYFHMIKLVCLPWDSERSASSETPIEEARKLWPNINWHSLDKERVDRGIDLVRRQLPNTIINSDKCDYLMECFNNYEYKRLEAKDDWAAKPTHNKYSHLMDAVRYAVMGIKEIDYFGLNNDGSEKAMPTSYTSWDEPEATYEDNIWTLQRKRPRRSNSGLYY